MGPFIDDVSITETLEFGNLATYFNTDTRLTARTEEHTVIGDPIKLYKTLGRENNNLTAYFEEPLFSEIEAITQGIIDLQTSPDERIISDEAIDELGAAFAASKAAGKPWQIFNTPVLMGKYPRLLAKAKI